MFAEEPQTRLTPLWAMTAAKASSQCELELQLARAYRPKYDGKVIYFHLVEIKLGSNAVL